MKLELQLVYLGALLFSAGLAIVLSKQNAIMILLGIELMLNSSNLNLVAFNRLYPVGLEGQMFALFVIIVAVCEAAVGMAIIVRAYRYYKTSVPDMIDQLKERS